MTEECQQSLYYSTFCMKGAAISGPSIEGFEAQNLSGSRNPWRSTGVSASLIIEFPESVSANTLVLAATNLSFDAQIELFAEATSVGAIDATRKGPPPIDCFGDETPDPLPIPSVLISDSSKVGNGFLNNFSVGGAAGVTEEELQVFIDGVRQKAGDDYSVADFGFDLTVTIFTTPPVGAILHFYCATELLSGSGIAYDEIQLGDGATDEFTLIGGAGLAEDDLEIYIDGLRQASFFDFGVSDDGLDAKVTFLSPPPNGARIHFYADFDTSQSFGDGARVADFSFIGTGAQSVFNIASSAGVTNNALEVFIDGLRQRPGVDYESTSLGSTLSVAFLTPPVAGASIYFFADSGIASAIGFGLESEDWPRRNIVSFFPEVSSNIWTLTIYDPNNIDGEIKAFRLIIDKPYVAEHVQDGWSIESVNNAGQFIRTKAGAVVPNNGQMYRIMKLKTTLMNSTNAYAKMRRDLALGYGQEMFIVLCPDDPALTESSSFLGAPLSIPEITAQASIGRFSQPLVLQELF